MCILYILKIFHHNQDIVEGIDISGPRTLDKVPTDFTEISSQESHEVHTCMVTLGL